jgi:hypothetical protein
MGEISIREYLALGLLAAIGLTVLVNLIVVGKKGIKKFIKWRKNRKRVKKDIYLEKEKTQQPKKKLKSDSTFLEEISDAINENDDSAEIITKYPH